jgi:sortase A
VRVFREGDSLLKVGVVMMAFALVLVVAAVVASAVLRSEPEGAVAEEVGAKSSGESPLYASGKGYSSGQDNLGYGSSSSSGVVGQQEEEAKGPQSAAASESGLPNARSGGSQPLGQQTPSAETSSAPEHQSGTLLGAEGSDWPKPTPQEIQAANHPRHYHLLPGAIMALTIPKIGIYNAPVYDSVSYWALANGIAHNPQTSLPWSETPQRNVYLAGHRMGFRGTWSRMLFYNLNELSKGDEVILRDREGRTYDYRVSEVFEVAPTDVWVMGQVRGRDMVTLQTCTPIPTFEKRLIVRADRV